MGYTHYWVLRVNDPVRFETAVSVFQDAWALVTEDLGDDTPVLRNIAGQGEPSISESVLAFNGDESEGLAGESFSITPDSQFSNFCQTGGKPYDLAACLALLSFKEIFGDDFTYASDGVTRERHEEDPSLPIDPRWAAAYTYWDRLSDTLA